MQTLLLSLLLTLSNFQNVKCNPKPLSSALYVFGDSLVDNGNNNFLPFAVSKYNYFPYGVDFRGGYPSGRASNGKIFPDFLAEYLGLPYPSPYRNPNRLKSILGYNYASAGCGILSDTGHTFGCTNLDTQVRDFQTTVEKELFSSFPNPLQLSQHLSNSIYLFSVGNNDYIANYLYPESDASSIYNPQQFAQLLIDGLSEKLQILYDLGARKVIILKMGPLGCSPYVRGVGHNETWCDKIKNQNATIFNYKLASMAQNLTSTYSDFHLTLAQFYQVTVDAFKNPENYGFSDARNPCCITEEHSPGCKALTKPCRNPNAYLYFDGVHPTEAMVSFMVSKCIKDSSFCFPMNVQQLVQAGTLSSDNLHSSL